MTTDSCPRRHVESAYSQQWKAINSLATKSKSVKLCLLGRHSLQTKGLAKEYISSTLQKHQIILISSHKPGRTFTANKNKEFKGAAYRMLTQGIDPTVIANNHKTERRGLAHVEPNKQLGRVAQPPTCSRLQVHLHLLKA